MLTDFFNKKINISLPNFHNHVFLNLCFLTLQENNKNVFRKGYEITAAEGCFSYSIWSLDRERRYTTRHDMETTINIYSKHNIPINYIFDNGNISKDDLSDNFSNLMLEVAHKEGNGVYVKSDLLGDYIKAKYPLYKIIKMAAPDEFEKNNIAIIDKYNNQFKKNDIKHKESTYITLNPICNSTCRHYDDHRKYIENEQVNFYRMSDIYICPLKRNFNFYDLKTHSNFITAEKMKDYIKAGFRNFRIDFPSMEKCVDVQYGIYDTIESYIYYMIKPENQQEVRHLITKKFAGNKNG